MILVLFTGGTIGSAEENGVINVDLRQRYRLISAYTEKFGDPGFECRQIMNILSENITSREWQTLIDCLYSLDLSAYEGVIVAHGSDTLAYTSALVGMLFSHAPVSIALIAANRPPDHPQSNASANFARAVSLIKNKSLRGVFTVYDRVYLATRLIPADYCTDSFSAFGGDSEEDILRIAVNSRTSPMLDTPPRLTKKVLLLTGYPDMDFSAANIPQNAGAALFVPYHSGTACLRDDMPGQSFSALAEKCAERDIPLYLCGVKGQTRYATLDGMLEYGISTLGRISVPAAYMKLLICINQTQYPQDEFMRENIYFEDIDM